MIFDPITDDAKSVPPVMQKPNSSHTHTTERQAETLRMSPFPMAVGGIWAWVCAHGRSCVSVFVQILFIFYSVKTT